MGQDLGISKYANFHPVSVQRLWPTDIDLAAEIDGRGEVEEWDSFRIDRCVRRSCYLKYAARSDWSPPGTLDGFLIARLSVGVVQIERIVVRFEVRRRKVASQLARTLFEELGRGKFQKAPILASVHEQNTEALAFFAKHGFVKVGTEKGKFADFDYGREKRDGYLFERSTRSRRAPPSNGTP